LNGCGLPIIHCVNFQQLRSVREAVRQGFNLTVVADVLHTSQPGVSRQIRELEEELGIVLFERAGKRLTGLTPPGAMVLPIIERLLQDADNLKRAGDEYAAQGKGTLTIAATHSQARYALPLAVRDFSAANPGIELRLHQGSPKQVAELLLSGEADIGVATEALAEYPELVALPCYQWTHKVIVPASHALAADAGAAVAVPAHHLRARLHRPQPHRRSLQASGPGAEAGAVGHGRRRHQDLCGTGHGRGHHRGHCL
jgi:LysR family cys regulon transcriptional activator